MNRFRQNSSPDTSAVARTDVGLRLPLLRQEGRMFSSAQERGRVVHPVFDFESIADSTFLGSFAADARRPNLLMHCHTADIPALVPRMARSGGASVRSCMVSGTLALPADRPSTLILHDVVRLSMLQQIEVMDWVASRTAETQVLSITSAPLRPLVEEGLFLQGLFHRLCVVEASATRRLWAPERRPQSRRRVG